MELIIFVLIILISLILLISPKLKLKQSHKNIGLEVTLNLISGTKNSLSNKQYKFYTELVLKLLHFQRELGAPISLQLKEIKKVMLSDYQKERVLVKLKYRSWFQFFMISLITWILIFFAMNALEISLNTKTLVIVSLMQISGILIFSYIFKLWKLKAFKQIDLYFKVLYSMRALIDAGMSINKVESESNISNLFESTKTSYQDINSQLLVSLESWKRDGTPIKGILDELISELWFRYDQKIEDFTKGLEVLKFTCLAIFYLGSYFVVISSLFSFFLQGF
jgi:hypothetical protein